MAKDILFKKEARERLFNEVIENIRSFYNGKMRNRVDK